MDTSSSEKRCLVTGGTGFVGSRVVLSLLEDGWIVFASKRNSSDPYRLGDKQQTVHWLSSDQFCPREMLERCGDLQAVVHIATTYGRTESAAHVVANNLLWPLELLEAAIDSKVASFIHTDTCYSPEYPFLQNYTLSKKQMVGWGRRLSGRIQFINLRLFHPIGTQDHPEKFVPWIVEQCLKNVPSIPLTSASQKKDFVDVGDVARAYVALLSERHRLGEGFSELDCGRGEAISVRSLVELVHRLSHSDSVLDFGALPNRDHEPEVSQADIAVLNRLGWYPKVTIEESIYAIINSHKL